MCVERVDTLIERVVHVVELRRRLVFIQAEVIATHFHELLLPNSLLAALRHPILQRY